MKINLVEIKRQRCSSNHPSVCRVSRLVRISLCIFEINKDLNLEWKFIKKECTIFCCRL